MNHTTLKLRMTQKSIKLSLFFLLSVSLSIFASDCILQYEIVPFDYADADMKEQVIAMVRDDQDIRNMTHETEDSMKEWLSGPDVKHKTIWFVCRATDGSAKIYGYMAYVLSDAAYLVGDPGSKDRSILLNSHDADEFIMKGDHLEPVADLVNFGFLDNFAVHKDYRGQGVAQAMLGYFEQDCRNHGKQMIVLGVEPDNEKAKRAYRRFGFETHSVYPIAMVKKLENNLVAVKKRLQYEIVPFDYADEITREQLCDMVDNDQELADVLNFTSEESMRKYLTGPDVEYNTQLLVCRSTDGLSTVYGFIMCSMHETFMDMKSVGFVNSIAVRKQFQGQGIAQALLNTFEKICRDNGIAQLLLGVARDNDKAIRVYQRNGFDFVAQKQDSDVENHEIPMIKLLN